MSLPRWGGAEDDSFEQPGQLAANPSAPTIGERSSLPGWPIWRHFCGIGTQLISGGADLIFDGPNDLVVDIEAMALVAKSQFRGPTFSRLWQVIAFITATISRSRKLQMPANSGLEYGPCLSERPL